MNQTIINIDNLFNHRSFGVSSEMNSYNDFTGISGSFLLKESLTKTDAALNVDFQISEYNKFDNINCIDRINVPILMNTKMIYLLGFAECGEFIEDIVVTFYNEITATVSISIPYLCFYTLYKDSYYEKSIWKNSWNKTRVISPYYQFARTTEPGGHLYCITCPVPAIDQMVNYITLPDNEMVHIYSISCSL